MRWGRWIALGEKYSGGQQRHPLGFALRFKDDDLVIGQRVFEELAVEQGFEATPAPVGEGYLETMDVLSGDTCPTDLALPLLRSLFEETSGLAFTAQSIKHGVVSRWIHVCFRTLVGRPIRQLVLPRESDLPATMKSSITYLKDGERTFRAWIRELEGGKIYYVGAVNVHRDEIADRAYLTVCLPLFWCNLAFVFQPFMFGRNEFAIRTEGSRRSQAGVYLVFPGRSTFSMVRVPWLTDEIQVAVENGTLRVVHRSRVLGVIGYDFTYKITKP